MKLKDLIGQQMNRRKQRQIDLARRLGVTKQVVSASLNRNLGDCKIKTVAAYIEAVGKKCKPKRLIV